MTTSSNYKNMLFEALQKRGYPVPKIDITALTDSNYKVIAKMEVGLKKDFKIITEECIGKDKKNLEQEICKNLYNFLIKNYNEPIYKLEKSTVNFSLPGIYIINLELFNFNIEPQENQIWIGFLPNNIVNPNIEIEDINKILFNKKTKNLWKNLPIINKSLSWGEKYIVKYNTGESDDTINHIISCYSFFIAQICSINEINTDLFILSTTKSILNNFKCYEYWFDYFNIKGSISYTYI